MLALERRGKIVMNLLHARGQFYIFLCIGFMGLLSATLFLFIGDFRVAFACLLMAVASPGLMPGEYYDYHLASRNTLIRHLATWGCRSKKFSLLLCICAVILMYTELMMN
ncbi:TPA: hypothetical protein RKX70_004124 [Escherichia coli]|uniref:hypothetical protein n=1 Tax=Klebsiella pneumoniae TaxID=573 RepID=UPI001848B0A0|nr:hypothetical protein [Escherichia coli]HDW0064437.1 hypothetical protein [Escherichia coli]